MTRSNLGTEKVVIIGGGPGGYSAAIYAARAGLEPLVFEGPKAGGQLMTTTLVENYPGFEHGIQGPELMRQMQAQAKNAGAQLVSKMVTQVDFSERPFRIWVGDELLLAEAVVIATGAQAKWLNLDSEREYQNKGVSACATCDGFLYKGKTVAVVGGGDTAMEEALYLASQCKQVYIIHRREEFRASPTMLERARQTPNIEFLCSSEVEEILGDGKRVTGLHLRSTSAEPGSEQPRPLPVDGLFVAIGHKPNTDLFEGQLALDENGYVVASKFCETSIPGVFVAGDVGDPEFRQAVVAAGMGAAAGIAAYRWLSEQGVEVRVQLGEEDGLTPPLSELPLPDVHLPFVEPADFNSAVLESELPVLVKFSAPWCAPCQQMVPIAVEAAEELGDQGSIVEVNVDQCSDEFIRQFDIQTIPLFVVFKGGQEVGRLFDMQTKEALLGLFPPAEESVAKAA